MGEAVLACLEKKAEEGGREGRKIGRRKIWGGQEKDLAGCCRLLELLEALLLATSSCSSSGSSSSSNNSNNSNNSSSSSSRRKAGEEGGRKAKGEKKRLDVKSMRRIEKAMEEGPVTAPAAAPSVPSPDLRELDHEHNETQASSSPPPFLLPLMAATTATLANQGAPLCP
eukprot:evm.model.NODE_21326_length_7012_cov_32.412151.3